MPPFDWQQDQWGDFISRIQNDRLPHAFMLVGQEGIGAEELAVAMGQYLLCLAPLQNVVCGRCRGCRLISSGTHPDFLRVHPDEPGKQIKIDQIRDIADKVDQTAQQGGHKVVVLSPAEAMNVNAANALLKNLEEPAGKSVFLLVTHQLNRVLPTIRSRCSKMALRPPKTAQALAWLEASGVVADGAQLLHEAVGAPLLAKRWHDKGQAQERSALLENLVQIVEHRLAPMGFAKTWGSADPMRILEQMLICLESVLALKLAAKPPPDHYAALRRACADCEAATLFRLRDRLCERKSQLLTSPNLNAALFIEELALDWAALAKAPRRSA